MEFKEFKDKLFEEAYKKGLKEFEIYYSDKESLSINIYKEEVEKYNLTKSSGVSFRAMVDGKMGYSYTEIIDEYSIPMLINNVIQSAKSIEDDDIQFIYEGDKDYEYVNNYHKELEDIDPQELINLALNMEKECKVISDKVTNFIGCGISYVNVKYGIINSKGLDLSDKSNLLTAYVVPVLDIEGKKYDGFGYGVAKKVTDIVPHKIAQQAIDEAMEKVGSKIAPSNKYKTIIRNEAMVSLLSLIHI